jgi:sulfur-oxidizing protein SoxY
MAPGSFGPIGRRGLIGGGIGIAAGLVLGLRSAAADPARTRAALEALLAGRTAGSGPLTLDLPRVADDGNAVQVTVAVESPMTAQDHVRAIHLLADGNPNPEVATFRFTPACGRASVTTRIRLARSQSVHALAEMADGRVFQVAREVTVTIGGCGA